MSSRAEQKAAARQKRIEAEQAAAAKEARTRRLQILGGVLAVAVVIVVALVVISSGGSAKKAASTTGKPAGIAQVNARFAGLPQRDLFLGRPDAPVTMVEFADLKCPVCRGFTLSAFPTLVQKYVRTGKLRIQMRLQTFVGAPPGDSEKAARMALASGQQDKLWTFADLYYLNQQDESTGYNTDAYLRRIGSGVKGLNVSKAMANRQDETVSSELQNASATFDAAGFTGTPSFELGKTGGRLQPFTPSSFDDPNAFTSQIDKLLSS